MTDIAFRCPTCGATALRAEGCVYCGPENREEVVPHEIGPKKAAVAIGEGAADKTAPGLQLKLIL